MASAYRCELSPHQRLSLSNQGDNTTVTLSSGSAGQQQQSSHGFLTGEWTSAPQIYRLAQAAVVVIKTARQTYYVQCQPGQVQMSGPTEAIAEAIANTQPASMEPFSIDAMSSATASTMPGLTMPAMPSMSPMSSMSPMPPMQMNNNPMSMQLGNMSMSMGEPMQAESTNATPPETSPKTNRFCTQCGAPAASTDKFCGACGHALT